MILVTGGSGLLGNVLLQQLLDAGGQVRAVYHRRPLAMKHQSLETVQCDLLDVVALEDVLKDVDEIYHCAGLVSFNKRDADRLYKINVEATANLVNAALEASVKKLVHVSSVAALGRIRQQEPVTEKMYWTPETSNSRYGETKYLGEMEVWRGIAEGLRAVIVNPTIILGAGNWTDGSTAIFKSVYDEFPWYATGTTGFVSAADVAKAMIMLMKEDITAQRFIVSAQNASYQQVFNAIADAFNKKRPHKKVTPFIAKLVTKSEAIKSRFTGKDPLLTKETAATAQAKVNFDNSKLLQCLPSFEYEPLQKTITETCAILQQKLNSV